MMDERVKKLWVDALRSGQYPQGRYSLQGEDGRFCCLGVLCDLAKKEEVCSHVVDKSLFGTFNMYDGEEEFLPESVMEWADIVGNPMVAGNFLTTHNDRGTPFAEIADLIDKHL